MKKIMLVGDSIRKGYDKYVQMALEGSAEVYYPTENCRFSVYVLRNLHSWLKESGFEEETDCLHWNVGLWDCLNLFDDGPMVPLEIYELYIDRICRRIRMCFPKAQVIFATSTPVDEAGYKNPKKTLRENSVIEQYNAAAVRIVTSYGFRVNDLYGLMKDKPLSWHSDKTHFYTKEATRAITDQVLQAISECVDVQIRPLDYDALFSE